MHPAIVRTQQGLHAIRAGFIATNALPAEIAALLDDRQCAAWNALPASERAHLARVGRLLLDRGETSADLLIAAVFHDIGKHTERGSVRLAHRVARVLLDRFAPGIIGRIGALSNAPGPLVPLWLSVHHAGIGMETAAGLGLSPRACWLIAHHEDAPPVSDGDLATLQWADDRC